MLIAKFYIKKSCKILFFYYFCGMKVENDTAFDKVFQKYGLNYYSSEYVDELRNNNIDHNSYIAPNEGSQETFLTTKAQVAFFAGVRGTGKTAALLQTGYPYVDKEYFRGAIFRNEKNDSAGNGGIADESKAFYKSFGIYKSSSSNMKWDFNDGGTLSFEYYSDAYKDFVKRYRGKEIPFIGIDEVTQIPFSHFTYLFSINRNSYGYRNIIRGTCNPEGNSWVFDFLKGEYRDSEGNIKSKYITEDGAPIFENSGKILYFFKFGDRPDECFWGETKEDVYKQGKNYMDRLYNSDPNVSKFMSHPRELALSFTLVSGVVSENKAVMGGGGEYIAKMGMMSSDDINRDALGLWVRDTDSESLVSAKHMDVFFNNPEIQTNDFRCVTADMSGSGRGDSAVLFYWEGFHLADCEFLQVGGETLKLAIDNFLEKHAVPRDHFCYDATGLGSVYEEYFDDAVNFVAGFPAFDKKTVFIGGRKQEVSSYENVRGQVFDNLAKRIRAHGYSVDKMLLYRTFGGKMLIDHLREEYPVIARKESNQLKFQAMEKKNMKAKIGHSPNFIDSWTLREYIELYYQKKKIIKRKGAWML